MMEPASRRKKLVKNKVSDQEQIQDSSVNETML